MLRVTGDEPVQLRAMAAGDWPAVAEIYAAGIVTGNATFETTVPAWEAWDAAHLAAHRLVATVDDRVVGWAAMSAVSERRVCAGVAEHSVYIHPDHRGRHVGRQLLTALLADAHATGIWTVQTGIFPKKTASVALHTSCGFRVVGDRERIGQLHGVWRDTLLLEHRRPD